MARTERRTPAIFDRPEAEPKPQYIQFSGFQAPPEAANPVIAFRYGRVELARPEAFVAPRFLPFPHFQEVPAVPSGASPIRGVRRIANIRA